MPTSEEILMAAAIKARDASEISEAWANGPENTTVETASGPLDTLAEFQRKRASDIMQGVRRVASVAALRLLPARYDGEVVYLASYYDGWAATLRGPVGGGPLVAKLTGTPVDDGGVNFAGPNAQWVRLLDGFVTPEMFGARGDFIADDVQKINAAINYQHSKGGGKVLLDAVTYGVGTSGSFRSVVMKEGVWLCGSGVGVTAIKSLPAANSNVIAFENNAEDVWVTDMTVDGNKTAQSLADGGVHCFRMQGNKRPKILRVHATNGVYYGLGVGYTVGVEEAVEDGEFDDLEISYCGNSLTGLGDGFDGKRVIRSSFNNIRCHHNVQRGMDIRGELNVYHNIWSYNNGATGISFRALALLPETISKHHYFKATNCYSYDNGDLGFFIANNENPIVGFESEYDLVNCHAWGNATEGFQHRGSDMLVRYVNCTADDNVTHGFRANSLDSNTNTRAIYTNCRALKNGINGFLVNNGVGKHEFITCEAKLNSGTDQVSIQAPDCVWNGGEVNAAGKTRGINATATAPRLSIIGGDFTSGSADAIRFDAGQFLLTQARLYQSSGTAVRVVTAATGGNIVSNDFSGVTGGTPISNGNNTTNIIANVGIIDALKTPYTAGHVNYVEVNSSASGQPVKVKAAGTNTSISFFAEPKGTGCFGVPIANVRDLADDAAASAAGVPVGGFYRTGSVLKIRAS